jgi:hypothetical protein
MRKWQRKVSSKQYAPPIFLLSLGEKSGVNFAPNGVTLPEEREVIAGSAKIEMENFIAWSMGILAPYI